MGVDFIDDAAAGPFFTVGALGARGARGGGAGDDDEQPILLCCSLARCVP